MRYLGAALLAANFAAALPAVGNWGHGAASSNHEFSSPPVAAWSTSGDSHSSWHGNPYAAESHFGHEPGYSWLATPASNHQAAPTVTLKPAVHWNVETSDVSQIVPSNVTTMYYSEDSTNDPDVAHRFGSIAMTFSVPAVNLDHSKYATVTASPNALKVVFNDWAVYDTAQDHWTKTTNLLLITFTESCGDYEAGERCYFSVSALDFDFGSKTITASGSSVAAADFLKTADFEWGTYSPARTTLGGGTPKAVASSSSASASPFNGGGNSGNLSASASFASGSTPTGTQTSSAPTPTISGNGSSATSSCSLDPVYGLPMAAIGDNFDNAVDDCLGYETIDNTTWGDEVESFGGDDEIDFTYIEDDSSALNDDDYLLIFNSTGTNSPTKVRRSNSVVGLSARGLPSIPDAFRKVVSILPVGVPGLNRPLTKTFNKEFPFKLYNKTVVQSPWGDANLLKRFSKETSKSVGTTTSSFNGSISLYCVGCGAQGSMDIEGRATFQADQGGLTEGKVTARTNIEVALQLGIDAQAQYQRNISQSLGSYGLPGFAFGIVTIGPAISIGADVHFNAQAQGQLLAGARFAIQNAVSVIDVVKPENSKSSGWTPEVKPVFNATGEINLSAEIGLPVALSCGIKITSGVFNKDFSVGIVEKPSLEASAQFSGAITTSGASITTNDCKGISTQITFKNRLFAEIKELKKEFDLTKPYARVLRADCIPLTKSGKRSLSERQSNDTAPADNSTFVDTTSDVIEGVSDATWTLPVFNTTGFNTTDGYEFVPLIDPTGRYTIITCPDENIYLQSALDLAALAASPCSALWRYENDTAIADGNGRLMHYYMTEMSKLNVSRLRVSDNQDIPDNVAYTALAPFEGSYYAVDVDDNVFYPAVCTYNDEGLAPKVFLVRDPIAGLETLKDENLRRVVTGGSVTDCYLLPLVSAA